MNWDQIEGNWKIYRGKIKERWGKLTDGDLDVIAGQYDQLLGHIQKTYGMVRKDAKRQIEEFMKKASSESVRRPNPSGYETDTDEERMDSDFGGNKKAG
jgi:uncharacterized protein YjbJ (UPF0337 family)